MPGPVRVNPDWRVRSATGDLHPGYLAGLIGGAGPVEVTVRRQVPVRTGTELVLDDGELLTRVGDLRWLPIARARPAAPDELDVTPHALPDLADALVAAAGEKAPSVACFICGSAALQPGGVALRVGRLDDSSAVAGVWSPARDQAHLVWGVLSCAGIASTRGRLPRPHPAPRRFVCALRGRVAVGRPHVVVAWQEPGHASALTTTVLLDVRGEVCAVLRQAIPVGARPADRAAIAA